MARFAGIEGGGTSFVIAFGTGPEDMSDPIRYETTSPGETLGRAVDEIRNAGEVDAIGFASFGPVDVDPRSPFFGRISETPKPGWSGVNVVGSLADPLGLPVALDTDVNGAALGEQRWGAAAGLETFIYLTVGTGVGGGGMYEGRPMHGLGHPEMGHMRLPRLPGDAFPGVCPYHGDCLEGLVAGPAIDARWGRRGEDLGGDMEEAVGMQAWYLGTGLANLALSLAPQRIVLGGGVMKMPGLIEAVRDRFLESLGGYLVAPQILDPRSYIVAPALGDRSGPLGALALAADLFAA
jgi:fructokinase